MRRLFAPRGEAEAIRRNAEYETRPAKSNRTVSKITDGRWANKKDGTGQVTTLHRTQAEACAAAQADLRKSGGGELKVKGKNGKIRMKDTVPPAADRPSLQG